MTFDVLVNVPATPTGATAPPSLPVYDRELSLSDNSSVRDAGMLAYISVNGATLPAAGGFGAAVAGADTYNSLVAGQTFSVLDPSNGVLANDTNVFGAQLLTAPTNGTVILTYLKIPSPACWRFVVMQRATLLTSLRRRHRLWLTEWERLVQRSFRWIRMAASSRL